MPTFFLGVADMVMGVRLEVCFLRWRGYGPSSSMPALLLDAMVTAVGLDELYVVVEKGGLCMWERQAAAANLQAQTSPQAKFHLLLRDFLAVWYYSTTSKVLSIAKCSTMQYFNRAQAPEVAPEQSDSFLDSYTSQTIRSLHNEP